MRTAPVAAGHFASGVPYLRVGEGPPLLAVSGLTPEHKNPTGFERRTELGRVALLSEHVTVYLVNRRPGVPAGTTMSDLAGDYAQAIQHELGGGPVAVHGVSTGGSLALQLAVDHPELVRRLVVVSAAYRLGPGGQQAQRDLGNSIAAGDARGAWARFGRAVAPGATGPLVAGAMWAMASQLTPDDPSDLLATIAAEDAFDVLDGLGRITAPTLVIGGERDPLYSPDLFRRTADGIPGGRLVLLRGKGHLGASAGDVTAALSLGFLLGG